MVGQILRRLCWAGSCGVAISHGRGEYHEQTTVSHSAHARVTAVSGRCLRRGVTVVAMNTTHITGLQLRLARQALGLSQEAAAELADLCGQTIKDWERSSAALPDAKVKSLRPAGSRLRGPRHHLSLRCAVHLVDYARPTMRARSAASRKEPCHDSRRAINHVLRQQSTASRSMAAT